MKQLYLIRHAKSSWSSPDLDDFVRPLNKRGKEDCPEMASRLAKAGIQAELIVASPAKRAKKTAMCMAIGTGYDIEKVRYDHDLYLGTLAYHLQLIGELFCNVDVLFLVGHNHILTELGEYLTGKNLGNVPTCGIVAVEYSKQEGFTSRAGAGRLLFFDFPKNLTNPGVYK